MKTAFVLAGPTGSGKSALALTLARRWNCEIINMDSMQVYRGMDIGTAKPSPEEMALVPHHLIDAVEPGESFTVTQWLDLALAAQADIEQRGRRALYVGGTGFYLRALRHPMAMGDAAADADLRAELQALADEPGGRERLRLELARVDPETAARLHPNDVRRVIRALEVYRLTGVPFSRQVNPAPAPDRPACRVAALSLPREEMYRRIDLRVDRMMAAGLPEEVRRLLQAGVPPESQAMKAIGYKELIPWARGQRSLEEAAAEIKLNTRHYAKRQLTWLRREEDVCWVEALAENAVEALEEALGMRNWELGIRN